MVTFLKTISVQRNFLFVQYSITNKNGAKSFMVFKATFNNISAISWQSVLLVDEIGVPRENNRPATSH
jgi:hypothetical protein